MCIATIEYFGIELLLLLAVQNHLCIAAIIVASMCLLSIPLVVCWLAFVSSRDAGAWFFAMRIVEGSFCIGGLATFFAVYSFGKWEPARLLVSLTGPPELYRPPAGPPRATDWQPLGPEEADG